MSMRAILFAAIFAMPYGAALYAETETASPGAGLKTFSDLSLPPEMVEKMRQLDRMRSCVTVERRYGLDERGCDALHRFEPFFERMLAIAGFTRGAEPGQVQLNLDESSPPQRASFRSWLYGGDPPGT